MSQAERRPFTLLDLALALAIAGVIALLVLSLTEQKTHADEVWLSEGSRGEQVVQVQYVLRSFNYVLDVDGIFGKQTKKAVVHFQRANGLRADGVVGPVTWDRLMVGAVATKPAERIPLPSGGVGIYTNTEGLRGMPFAPEGLDECAEMNWYRVQAGLPEIFSDQPHSESIPKSQWGRGWRESNCKNYVGNYCCYGYWGIHAGNINNPWTYGPFVKAHCKVFSVSDYRGSSPLQKQKSACFAKVLYDISGDQPWDL